MLTQMGSLTFVSSEKQYKTQFKKWNLDTKYVKASEYLAMVRIRREREAGNPPKETQFILRGRVVENKDITRFEKRASKKGTLQLDEDLDDGTLLIHHPCRQAGLTKRRSRRGSAIRDPTPRFFWLRL